jgi:hypothetical protein
MPHPDGTARAFFIFNNKSMLFVFIGVHSWFQVSFFGQIPFVPIQLVHG